MHTLNTTTLAQTSARRECDPRSGAMVHGRCSHECLFFFSSRRRHTRFDCDWSSDVCSSDLLEARLAEVADAVRAIEQQHISRDEVAKALADFDPVWDALLPREKASLLQIGRASCRERV